MSVRGLARLLSAALNLAPSAVRATLVIEATRRERGGPVDVAVGMETTGADGQSVRRFGRADERDETDALYALALRDALDDDPTSRHASDAEAWLARRAADVLRRDRRGLL